MAWIQVFLRVRDAFHYRRSRYEGSPSRVRVTWAHSAGLTMALTVPTFGYLVSTVVAQHYAASRCSSSPQRSMSDANRSPLGAIYPPTRSRVPDPVAISKPHDYRVPLVLRKFKLPRPIMIVHFGRQRADQEDRRVQVRRERSSEELGKWVRRMQVVEVKCVLELVTLAARQCVIEYLDR